LKVKGRWKLLSGTRTTSPRTFHFHTQIILGIFFFFAAQLRDDFPFNMLIATNPSSERLQRSSGIIRK